MQSTRVENNFTQGSILAPLVKFALPVLLALFLQSMYGAVDLLVVGQFGTAADVSAVATGSHIMMTLTNVISSLAMGATILLGRQIGEGNAQRGGETIGACMVLFGLIAVAMTLLVVPGAGLIATIMRAPEGAFDLTVSYVRICGAGFLVIVAYNFIGSVFRGIGDSTTPLKTVAIACVTNIAGDLLLVAHFHMGTAGAAIATVFAQLVSVLASLWLISRRPLPFTLSRRHLRFDRGIASEVLGLGFPIALSDLLVSISFLVIQAIVNGLGVIPSAGVGVAERVCAFIMLVPSSFSQAMTAFVAQNAGANRYDRAVKALKYGIGVSLLVAIAMFYLSFFRGDLLSGIFSNDPQVIAAAADYLRAYGIDCLLTPIFFCFIGFYNGIGMTRFVMLQGIVSAFCVRVPVSWLMSRHTPVSLFRVGLATPCSSALQIVMCLGFMAYLRRGEAAGLRRQ